MSRALLWLVLLGACSAQAQLPYRRSVVGGRALCVAWHSRQYVYHYGSAGSERTPGDSEFSALEASFDTWRALSATCSDYAFVRGPDLASPRVGYVLASDEDPQPANESVIVFREHVCGEVVSPEDGCLARDSCADDYGCWDHPGHVIGLTTTTFSTRTGKLLDADIELNASGGSSGYLFTTVNSPPCEPGAAFASCVSMDLQNTMTHEVGHAVGLDHVAASGSTMEPTAPPGETHKRVLDSGSAEGFCSIYPRGLPPTQCLEPVEAGHKVLADARLGCAVAPAALLPAALLAVGLLRPRRRRAPPGCG